jgi:hypothetical protein
MPRRDGCIFNKFIQCQEQVKCARCTWNPTYFEHLKEKRKEERKAGGRKYGKNNSTVL